jgi:hypothetical protein
MTGESFPLVNGLPGFCARVSLSDDCDARAKGKAYHNLLPSILQPIIFQKFTISLRSHRNVSPGNDFVVPTEAAVSLPALT